MLGLFHASQSFDETQAGFASYASFRIRGSIIDGLRQRGQKRRKGYAPSHYLSELLREDEDFEVVCYDTPGQIQEDRTVDKFTKLSDAERDVLWLRFWCDYTFEEMADTLKVTRNRVRHLVSYAVMKLQQRPINTREVLS